MAAIQDGWQYVKVKDWPKLSSVRFLLQVSKSTLCFIKATFVISGNGHIQDGREYVKVKDWPKLSSVRFYYKSLSRLYAS